LRDYAAVLVVECDGVDFVHGLVGSERGKRAVIGRESPCDQTASAGARGVVAYDRAERAELAAVVGALEHSGRYMGIGEVDVVECDGAGSGLGRGVSFLGDLATEGLKADHGQIISASERDDDLLCQAIPVTVRQRYGIDNRERFVLSEEVQRAVWDGERKSG